MRVTLGIVLALLSVTGADAAEIQGRVWSSANAGSAPGGALLKVTCGSVTKNTALSGNGSYSFRGLPPNTSCAVSVTIGSSTSQPIAVRTNETVVMFSAEVRSAGNSVIVLRR